MWGKQKAPWIPRSEAPQVRSSRKEQAWPLWDLFPGLKTRGVPRDLLGCARRRMLSCSGPASVKASKLAQDRVQRSPSGLDLRVCVVHC